MPQLPTLVEMLKAGVHFGHKTSKRHPKMDPYIFTIKSGVHIINLEETTRLLKEALDYVKSLASKNGVILFLGTKKAAANLIKKHALECGMPYVSNRWIGGSLTNFSIIKKQIRKLKDLKKKREEGELKKYTKKEQLEFDREIERLEAMVGGIQDMEKMPDAIFIVDIKNEETAIREAKRKNVPMIAVCDTNTNPRDIKYPIPGNDDSVKSIEIMIKLVAEAVKEGTALIEANKS